MKKIIQWFRKNKDEIAQYFILTIAIVLLLIAVLYQFKPATSSLDLTALVSENTRVSIR